MKTEMDRKLELEMSNKQAEKLFKVQQKIGQALDNLPIDDVLYVLADLTRTILDTQEPPRRKRNAEIFSKMISQPRQTIVLADENGKILQ